MFLSFMALLIYSGKNLCLLCIFQCGMLYLSAVSIILVSSLLPWCTLVGNGVFVSDCSISFVKSFQFAIL